MKRTRTLILAGVGLSIVLTAIGTFKGPVMPGKTRMEDQFVPWLIVLVAIVVVAGVCIKLTPRVLGEGKKPGTSALVCAILSVLSNAVFWLGIPSVLAGAAVGWAGEARSRGQSRLGSAAIVLSVISVLGAIWVAFTG